LKAYLDKRDLISYLSQELAIREDLMEEKLKSLIDQKPTTLKTEDQEPDADSAPASDEQESKSIRQALRTAVQDDRMTLMTRTTRTLPAPQTKGRLRGPNPPLEDRRKQARGRRRKKDYTGSRLFKHAEKLPKFKGRDDESFSVWLGKYEMMMFTLYEQSKETAYDCLEIALEEEAHSSWKNWTLENPEEEPKNWKTFKKWAEEAWNG